MIDVLRNPSTKIRIDSKKPIQEKATLKFNTNLQNMQSGLSSALANTNNYKTKSEFQKRLMSDNNIVKYKTMCIVLLKEEEGLKKLCEFCGFFPNNFEILLEQHIFNDKVFLYKLEVLLSSDSNLNKLKKEKFFREEIKSKLEFKSWDLQYEQKLKNINFAIDNHINNIQNFDF
jgi:hypothetical protein